MKDTPTALLEIRLRVVKTLRRNGDMVKTPCHPVSLFFDRVTFFRPCHPCHPQKPSVSPAQALFFDIFFDIFCMKKIMSGHVSELSACGLRYDVVTKLTNLINMAQGDKASKFHEDDVFATYYFLATNGSFKSTAFAMSNGGGRKGWSEVSTSRKVHSVVEAISKSCSAWVEWPSEILFHENNSAQPYFSDKVRIVVDTVPIKVPNIKESNQFFSGKYKEHDVKLLGVGTLTGFYAWYPECLYTATSGDQVLMQHSGMLEHMAKLKIKALADDARLAHGAGTFPKGTQMLVRPLRNVPTPIGTLSRAGPAVLGVKVANVRLERSGSRNTLAFA